jgi:hypothetical protein
MAHKKPRPSVKDSFNRQVTKFPHTESKRQRIAQGGRYIWNYIRSLWDLQTLFFNLFTCSAGSQVTGALGVHPPSIHDYFDIPNNEVEEDFLQINDYYI